MDRSFLKAQARDRISHAKPSPLLAGLIFVIISIIISFLSFKLVDEARQELFLNYFDPSQMQGATFEEIYENFDYDSFMREYTELSADTLPRVLNLALKIMSLMLGVGMMIFALNTLKGQNASCWNLFDSFAVFGRVILLYILEGIFLFLWALLFFFPAIIAYYRYSQAIYLLIDHPEMSPMQCIRESSRLMRGHKFERFVLDLSFIGWLLLMGFIDTLGSIFGIPVLGTLIGIWFYPFYYLTIAGYYRSLTGDDIPDNDGWVPEL